VRDSVLGGDQGARRRALLVAAALTGFTASVALVSELASLPAGKLSLYGFPLVGAVLAGASAYRNSGLLVCWLLALAPVVGPLVVYRAFMFVRESVAVALPLSFYGVGAGGVWLPVALLLGTLAFCAGVAARWAVGSRRR